MAIVKVSWSGEKDSTCALDMHLEQGDQVKAVCYVPMLADDIPLIMPDHYKYIEETAEYFRKKGAEVYIVHGVTYFDLFSRVKQKGYHIGMIYGFPIPLTGRCFFQGHSKRRALDKCDVGQYDYQDLGIAYDEPKRWHNVDGTKKRSILIEKEITEMDALRYCIERNLLSPTYKNKSRDGCALCYNSKPKERYEYFRAYPQAIDIILQMQETAKYYQKQVYDKFGLVQYFPLRKNKWFIEPKEYEELNLLQEDNEIYIFN